MTHRHFVRFACSALATATLVAACDVARAKVAATATIELLKKDTTDTSERKQSILNSAVAKLKQLGTP